MIEFVVNENQIMCCPLEEITADNASEIRDKIAQELEQNDKWELLGLDCSNLTNLDSIAINIIIGLFKKAKLSDKVFKISNCNESVIKSLKLFKLDQQFVVE